MSKISVLVESPISLDVVMAIKKVTGLSLNEIRQRVAQGASVKEYLLFFNDHEAVAQSLRKLVAVSTNSPSLFHFFELEEDESFNPDDVPAVHEICTETLLRIIEKSSE